MIQTNTLKKQGIHFTFWNIIQNVLVIHFPEHAILIVNYSSDASHLSSSTACGTAITVSAAGGKSQAFSIAVKNIHMPRMKNTIPSIYVALLQWCHSSRGSATIKTRE